MIPSVIFIIPYRDRKEQRKIFEKEMKDYLEHIELDNYEFYFVCQKDKRLFNRGAMKNLGFLYIKYKYPDDYKNITLVFNDVDTLPTKESNIKFEINQGTIAHYYGWEFALGGIFTIKGGDFEKTTGFPNYWHWGCEDNSLQTRALKVGLKIDRTIFYHLHFNEISNYKYITRLDINDNPIQILSDYDLDFYKNMDKNPFNGGFKEIQKVNTDVKIINNKNMDINIYFFECEINYEMSLQGGFKQNFRLSNKIKTNPLFRMFYM
jgi:hypothetical protein